MALSDCGPVVVTETLYATRSLHSYFENVASLRRRHYDDGVRLARQLMLNVEVLRGGCNDMQDMVEVGIRWL